MFTVREISDSNESECYACKRITWAPEEKVGIVLRRTGSGKYTAAVM